MNNPGTGNVWKGLVAGAVGGVVASWTKDRFQYWWLSFGGGDELPLQQMPSSEGKGDEPATVKTGSAISAGVFGHSLTVTTAYPFSTHAYALASHLVFGLTAEVVRSTVRRVL